MPLRRALLWGTLLACGGRGTDASESARASQPVGLGRARVAIVGGGIGGASVASFLLSEFADIGAVPPEIVVYEQSDRIGGRTLAAQFPDGTIASTPRLRTALQSSSGSAQGTVVELGASMAIEQNRYVREMAERLGLHRRHATDRPGRGSGKLAILSGGRFAFVESDYKLVTVVSMLARYGLVNFYKLRSHGERLISAFDRIYGAQDQRRAFREPRSLLGMAGMDGLSERSCEGFMAQLFGDAEALISRELLGGLMMNNYGQDWRGANALVCATAVAPLAAGGSASAWSVVEGNDQLATKAFQEAGAEVQLGRRVLRISRHIGEDDSKSSNIGGYVVQHSDATCESLSTGSCETQEQSFDFVFITAPRKGDAVVDLAPDSSGSGTGREKGAALNTEEYQYQHVHSTLVWGRLNPKYFNLDEMDEHHLNSLTDILVDGPTGGVPFSSIGHYGGPRASDPSRENGNVSLWKFFSSAPLVRSVCCFVRLTCAVISCSIV